MRVETLGEDVDEESAVAAVAAVEAVHGDEHCGARAIERLLRSCPVELCGDTVVSWRSLAF